MVHRIGLSLLLLVCASIVGTADTIVLKNGSKLSGTVFNYGQDPFLLKLENGTVSFGHDEVTEVIFDDASSEANKNAVSRIRGDGAKTAASEEETEEPLDEKQLGHYHFLMESLEKKNDEDEDWGYTDERQRIVKSLSQIGPQVAPYLERELKTGNSDNAEYVLRALMAAAPKRGSATAVKLATCAKSGDVRLAALSLLGAEDVEKYKSVIALGMQDKLGNVRAESIRLVSGTKDFDVAGLVDYLSDPVRSIRKAAQESLAATTGQSLKTAEEWSAWFEAQK